MNVSRRLALKSAAGLTALAMGAITIGRSGAQEPSPPEVDAPDAVRALLDPNLRAELLRVVDVVDSTYYAFAQFDDQGSGEPIFVREPQNGEPVLIEDVRGLPLELIIGEGGDAAAGADTVDLDIALFGLPELDLQVFKPEGDAAAGPEVDRKVFEAAKGNLGMSSADAAGTNHGRLACAWAVNRIVKRALGREIGGGLATANMYPVLKARHLKVPESSVTPGTIVISPTTYSGGRANVGHVGIVGENNQIYSNSSPRARWEQNFTTSSWRNYYERRKGLSVSFFRLDKDYF